MYHLHTSALELSDSTFQYINSQSISKQEGSSESRLRAMADLSFDLLSDVQKMEKLFKLNQLSKVELAEYTSNIRLIGIMIHILSQYKYQDLEMMGALSKRFQRFAGVAIQTAA